MIHLSNNYISSKVHSELIKQLALQNGSQQVIVPIRTDRDFGKNLINDDRVHIDYIRFNSGLIRYFPMFKILRVFTRCLGSLFRAYELEAGQGKVLALAHNLWSDGMVLFLFSFVRPLQFVLVCRNTDINIFLPRLIQYHWLLRWAIARSRGLVFVSMAHRIRFETNWPKLFKAAHQVSVIPNGIDSFWLNNQCIGNNTRPFQCCFVGRFDHNKNLKRLIRASTRIAKKHKGFRLVLIGGDEIELTQVLGEDKIPSFVTVKGKIDDKWNLKSVYSQSRVLAMPSLTETFGLVYIEALSQGCALLCSRNEGVDGYFDAEICQSVNPYSVDDIYDKLLSLMQRNNLGLNIDNKLDQFNWADISNKYMGIFR